MPQMPKRVKYRKSQRGVVRGRTTRKKYVGVDYLDSSLFYTYLLPSARSWDDDDRSVVCFVTSPGEPLQRSVKGSRL